MSNNVQRVAIFGAGGQAGVAAQVLRGLGDFALVAFVARLPAQMSLLGAPVIAETAFDPSKIDAVHVAIGDNALRAGIFARLMSEHPWLSFPALVDRRAIVAEGVPIGPGSLVMPGAVINIRAHIGANCIINTSSIVEHDCVLEDHTFLGPGGVICGGCRIGSQAHVGAGATVLETRRIGARAVVGAGAVVVRDVAQDATVTGVPAR